jgi:hypothetical protein
MNFCDTEAKQAGEEQKLAMQYFMLAALTSSTELPDLPTCTTLPAYRLNHTPPCCRAEICQQALGQRASAPCLPFLSRPV